MSDQDNLFTAAPATPVAPADLLASIKNEAGEQKYKTIEDALKALASSQAFIPQLLGEKKAAEEELLSLREKVNKIDSIEDVIKKLTANDDNKQVVTPPASGLSAEAVQELVRNSLLEQEKAKVQKDNLAKVDNALKQKFGDKTKEVIAAKAAELGSSPEELGKLAVVNPNMVLALFNTPKGPSFTPTTSSVSLPATKSENFDVAPPAKSVLLGATSRDQKAHMLEHKAAIYKKYGIEA